MIKLLLAFSLILPPSHANWVSVVPAITEAVHEVGAGAKIVGVSSFCQYSKKACQKTKVGTPFTPDLEKIIALKPTLVLTQKIQDSQFEKRLKKLEIPFRSFRLDSFGDVLAMIKNIGKLAKKEENKLVENILEKREKLNSLKKTGRFLAVISAKNLGSKVVSLTGVGKDTYIEEILEMTGLTNWLTKFKGYKEVSMASIIKDPPDMIFYFSKKEMGELPLKSLKTYKMDPTFALIPGPRVYLFMDDLYETLNP